MIQCFNYNNFKIDLIVAINGHKYCLKTPGKNLQKKEKKKKKEEEKKKKKKKKKGENEEGNVRDDCNSNGEAIVIA